MAVTDLQLSYLFLTIPVGLLLFVSSYIYAHFVTYRHLRGIPSRFPAQFTDLWAFWNSYNGKTVQRIHQLHQEKGKIVRLQPNHVSIADDGAIQMIYGHGNGLIKSEFYDAFIPEKGATNIFITRDRAVHAHKRKMLSHAYSPNSLAQLEPYIRMHIELFIQKLDQFTPNSSGEKDTQAKGTKFNFLNWLHYLTFDIISDLSFGAPFNMLQNGADLAEMKATPQSPGVYVKAIEILSHRAMVNTALGHVPRLIPLIHRLFRTGKFRDAVKASKNLLGIAIARVEQRLDNPPPVERHDLLARVIENQERDTKGDIVDRRELVSAAFVQLIAGSDTTSNSLGGLIYFVANTPRVMEKLQDELDTNIPADTDIPTHDMVRNLPYLNNVIKEALRYHSLVGMGLPRQQVTTAPTGLSYDGHYFPPGTVLSVPSYTIHHSEEIWGPDVEEFRPERWENPSERQKAAFMPFGIGPRACIGRNLAEMELRIIAASIFRRYTVDGDVQNGKFEVWEGLVRKPINVMSTIRKREIQT